MSNFEKLQVWQESIQLVKDTYRFCDLLPRSEERNLIDQLKRASVSISLNIAEGSGSGNDKEFRRFLIIARKSALEVEAVVKVAESLYHIDIGIIHKRIEMIIKLINGLIRYLQSVIIKSADSRPLTAD